MYCSDDCAEIFATLAKENPRLCDLLIISAKYKAYVLIENIEPFFDISTSRDAFDVILSGLKVSGFSRHTCL